MTTQAIDIALTRYGEDALRAEWLTFSAGCPNGQDRCLCTLTRYGDAGMRRVRLDVSGYEWDAHLETGDAHDLFELLVMCQPLDFDADIRADPTFAFQG